MQIPTFVDLFRWHGAEEVEHRNVAHDVATYFSNSYLDRVSAMLMASTFMFVMFQRFVWHLVKTDPEVDFGWLAFSGCATSTPSCGSSHAIESFRHQHL